jgi:hypothetical protein
VSPGPGEAWTGIHAAQWTASDDDGDDLTFTLLYSPDDGFTWFPVASGLTENQVDVDSSLLAASDMARLRVIATDGFHTVHDQSAATFTVSDAPPEVTIDEPPAGATVAVGTLVEFRGTARGKDGGTIPGDDYVWLLDDEPIATGRSVNLRIPDEVLTLKLQVAEGDGPVGEASLPVPEPRTHLAWLAALGTVAWLRRRRAEGTRGSSFE